MTDSLREGSNSAASLLWSGEQYSAFMAVTVNKKSMTLSYIDKYNAIRYTHVLDSNSNTATTISIVGVVFGSMAFLLIGLIIYKRKRRRPKNAWKAVIRKLNHDLQSIEEPAVTMPMSTKKESLALAELGRFYNETRNATVPTLIPDLSKSETVETEPSKKLAKNASLVRAALAAAAKLDPSPQPRETKAVTKLESNNIEKRAMPIAAGASQPSKSGKSGSGKFSKLKEIKSRETNAF
jgi:hypothetical protein